MFSRKRDGKVKKFIKELIPYIVIVVVVVLIRSFLVTPGLVNGSSMENTLYNNDLVIVNKIALRSGINRYDIVVINYNKDTLIKRVIGPPGEKVSYIDDELYINDEKIETPIDFEYTSDFEMTAGEDEYIVLGDNRNVSKDSRSIGPVSKKDIKGKVDLVLFPFKRFGFIKWVKKS